MWYRGGHASDFDTGVNDLNGWEHRVSNLTMKVSPVFHDTMFTPTHIKGLAQVLKGIFAGFPTAEVCFTSIERPLPVLITFL